MAFILGEGRGQATLFPVTLDELIAEDHVCPGTSIDDLEDRWVKHPQPFFSHIWAAEVTTELCRHYIVWRQESGVADATINRTLATSCRCWKRLNGLPLGYPGKR